MKSREIMAWLWVTILFAGLAHEVKSCIIEYDVSPEIRFVELYAGRTMDQLFEDPEVRTLYRYKTTIMSNPSFYFLRYWVVDSGLVMKSYDSEIKECEQ